jgi:hypothetical protein
MTMPRPSCTPISDALRLAFLKQRVFSLWGAPPAAASPCPLPVSMQAADLATLAAEPYLVGAKLDGTRYLLLLTQYPAHLGGQQVTVLIDRGWTMYAVYASARRSVFEAGSLFDGELVTVPIPGVEGRTRHVFFVFDAVAVRGASLCARPFTHRLAAIKALFFTDDGEDVEMMRNPGQWVSATVPAIVRARDMVVSNGTAHYLGFRVKSWLLVAHVETVLRCGGQMGAPWDGLVFMPVADAVATSRRHPRMFKWKRVHTVDLIVSEANELLYYNEVLGANTAAELMTVDGRRLLLVCGNLPPPAEAPRGAVSEFQIVQVLPPLVPDGAHTVLLSFVAVRDDKANANLAHTVLATVDNVECPVTEEALVAACRRNACTI